MAYFYEAWTRAANAEDDAEAWTQVVWSPAPGDVRRELGWITYERVEDERCAAAIADRHE